MAALALPLGPLLRAMPPLRAYAIDIAGSMAGIAAFALLSARDRADRWFLVWRACCCCSALGQGHHAVVRGRRRGDVA